jgi:hypothetical protein
MSEQPLAALRDVASEMLRTGYTRAQVINRFEALSNELRRQHRLADEEVVLDVMDAVVGFASPHTRL